MTFCLGLSGFEELVDFREELGTTTGPLAGEYLDVVSWVLL